MIKLEQLRGAKVLVIASTGGHLEQAVAWSTKFEFSEDSLFVTFETAQSVGLLSNRRHLFVRYVPPRGIIPVFQAAWRLNREVRTRDYDFVLSTGAGLAFSILPQLIRSRQRLVYIESVSRFAGPSTTGRILQVLPFVCRYTQHDGYDTRKWIKAPSLMDDYVALSAGEHDPSSALKIFVTLGTIKPYRFDRMVDSVLAALRPDDVVTWQLGVTHRDDLPGCSDSEISGDEFKRICAESDVVVTHAGVGTLMTLLNMGKKPIVFSRLARLGEHVDNHQEQVASELHSRKLALSVSKELKREDLLSASGSKVDKIESFARDRRPDETR